MNILLDTGTHKIESTGTIAAPVADNKITKLAFRHRFTFAERVAIETASASDASVRVMMKDQESATYIDIARQDTIDGVNALATATLITPERAASILTDAIQEIERP